jgi:hypothetical protein
MIRPWWCLVLVAALVSCGTTAAGAQPSKQAKQICSSEAQGDLTTALHLKPKTTPTGRWSHGTYTCRDDYPGATVTMTVHDLPTLATTQAYFNKQATQRGKQQRAQPLSVGADDAFVTTNGSVVARKDTHVLVVDVSAVPASFSAHAMTKAELPIVIAAVIMACWSGS